MSCESATEPTDGVIPASSSAKTSAVPTDDESAIYRDPDLRDDAGIRPVGIIVVAVVLTAGPMVTVDPMAADATVTVVGRAGVLVRCQNRVEDSLDQARFRLRRSRVPNVTRIRTRNLGWELIFRRKFGYQSASSAVMKS